LRQKYLLIKPRDGTSFSKHSSAVGCSNAPADWLQQAAVYSPPVLACQLLHCLRQLRRDGAIAWQQLYVCAACVGAHGPAQRLGTSLANRIVVQPQPQAAACKTSSQSCSSVVT
jgi:hypothetical protein